MKRCQHLKRAGTQCHRSVQTDEQYCWQHKKMKSQRNYQFGGMDGETQIKQKADTTKSTTLNKKLIHAVDQNNLTEVKQLIDQGADPNYENDRALRTAVYDGYNDIVKELLKYRDPDSIKEIDSTTLQWAIDQNNLEALKLLFSKLRNLDANDANLSNVKNTQIIDYIEEWKEIQKNRDPNLLIASETGDLNLLKTSLQQGADVHYMNDQALINASKKGYANIVHELLEHGADAHVKDDYPLDLAVSHNHPKVIRELFDHGVDIHILNDRPIEKASSYDNIEAVKTLLDLGADPKKIYVSKHSKPNIINELNRLKKQKQVTKIPLTKIQRQKAEKQKKEKKKTEKPQKDLDQLLIENANKGNIQGVLQALKFGANVNVNNNKALQVASEKGHLEIVKTLLEHGANPSAVDTTWIDSKEIIELLETTQKYQK